MSTATADPGVLPEYPSLAALRLGHRKLLDRFERNNPSPEVVGEVKRFLADGCETGTLLRQEEHRNAAQAILDYWTTVLYRIHEQPPEAQLLPYKPAARPSVASPYPGLAPFDATNRDFFQGRQAVVATFVQQLVKSRVLVITGPRGCGKSSLVAAGLLPALQGGALAGSELWTYLGPTVVGTQPLENLARAVAAGGSDIQHECDRFRTDTDYLTHVMRRFAGTCVLVLDQLEDVLPGPGESIDRDQRAFLENVVNLVHATEVPCVVIATRTDDPIDTRFRVADDLLLESVRADVPELGTGELRDAIQVPAELVGVSFEKDVVNDLVRALVGVPVAAPLLQFILAALWDARSTSDIGDQSTTISWEAYRAFMWDPNRRRSNAAWALSHTAQKQFDSLDSDPDAQSAFRKILLELVVPGDGSEKRLRRMRVGDLRRAVAGTGGSGHHGDAAFTRALDVLLEARLLRSSPADGVTDSDSVEVVHIGLANYWSNLNSWLFEERNAAELRRRARVQRIIVGLSGVIVVLVICVAALLVERARQETRLADSHLLLAQASQTGDPAAALLMAVEANMLNPGPDARDGLLSQLARDRNLVAVLPSDGKVGTLGVSPDGQLLASSSEIAGADPHMEVMLWDTTEFKPRQQLDLRELGPAAQLGTVSSLVFDSSGEHLAVLLNNGDNFSVGIWSTSTGRPVVWPDKRVLAWHGVPTNSLGFASVGNAEWLMGARIDGLIDWDVETGAVAHREASITLPPMLAISPDGALMAAAGCASNEALSCDQTTLRVWIMASGTPVLAWQGTAAQNVTRVWFSPAGRVFGATRQDGSVELRLADALDAPAITVSPSTGLLATVVDDQETSIISGTCLPAPRSSGATCPSQGNALRRLDLGLPAGSPSLAVPAANVGSVALIPRQQPSGAAAWVAVPRADSVLVLDMGADSEGGDPLAVSPSLVGLGPSLVPVGSQYVASRGCVPTQVGSNCPKGAIHLADPRTGNPVGDNLGDSSQAVTSLAAAPDGSLVASAIIGQINLFAVADGVGSLLTTLPVPSNATVSVLAVAPGRVAAFADGHLYLWTFDDPSHAGMVDLAQAQVANVSAASFSPDGDWLVAGGTDGSVAGWRVADGTQASARLYPGQTSGISSIASSPDDTLVAAGSSSGNVLIWDLDTTQAIGDVLVPENLQSGIPHLTFSNDDQTLIANDGSVETSWQLQIGKGVDLVNRACEIAHRNLARSEWEKLHIQIPSTPACPQWPNSPENS
jgi:WD40 repeat protein